MASPAGLVFNIMRFSLTDGGDPGRFTSFEEVLGAFRRQLHRFIDIKVRGNNVIERLYVRHMHAPFLSQLIDDCIASGRDYNDGGPRYNTTYIMGVAPATTAASLSAIKRHVFDRQALSMTQVAAALAANFEGHEKTRDYFCDLTAALQNEIIARTE